MFLFCVKAALLAKRAFVACFASSEQHPMSTRVSRKLQHPCPSNTRRWFCQFLVILLGQGGGGWGKPQLQTSRDLWPLLHNPLGRHGHRNGKRNGRPNADTLTSGARPIRTHAMGSNVNQRVPFALGNPQDMHRAAGHAWPSCLCTRARARPLNATPLLWGREWTRDGGWGRVSGHASEDCAPTPAGRVFNRVGCEPSTWGSFGVFGGRGFPPGAG